MIVSIRVFPFLPGITTIDQVAMKRLLAPFAAQNIVVRNSLLLNNGVFDDWHYNLAYTTNHMYFGVLHVYGVNRLGSLGNSDVLRTLFSPQNSITTRSSPTPHPP